MNEKDIVRFSASVAQVKTMADGGLRVSLDLSDKEIDTAAKLMQAKQAGAILEIALVLVDAQKAQGAGVSFDWDNFSFPAFPALEIKRIA